MLHRPADRDLTFCLVSAGPPRDAAGCLESLRRHHPHAGLMLIADGNRDPAWPAAARRHGARFHAGAQLDRPEYGGRLLQRTLDLFAESPTDYLILLDPTARAHRPLRVLPLGPVVFGHLRWVGEDQATPLAGPVPQRGCIGLTRASATALSDSGLLRSGRWARPMDLLPDHPDVRRATAADRACPEILLAAACRSLHLELIESDEISPEPAAPAADRHAFTLAHPMPDPAAALAATLGRLMPAAVRTSFARFWNAA